MSFVDLLDSLKTAHPYSMYRKLKGYFIAMYARYSSLKHQGNAYSDNIAYWAISCAVIQCMFSADAASRVYQ